MSQIGENAYFWKQSRVLLCRGHRDLLAAMRATSHPAWAALSTSGLGTLDLPKDIRDVIVLADGDDHGEAAARDCAWRWKREGRRVRIARPPQGMDFEGLLRNRTRLDSGPRISPAEYGYDEQRFSLPCTKPSADRLSDAYEMLDESGA